eukprot:jgi/Chrzof1/14325/UNPLg00598.t1
MHTEGHFLLKVKKAKALVAPVTHVTWVQIPALTNFKFELYRILGTPLDVHGDTTTYYSLHPEDAVFGGTTNAHSCPWTGAAEANPEYEPEDMQEAMKWATGTATQIADTQVYNVMVLPHWGGSGTAYQRWLLHPTDKKRGKREPLRGALLKYGLYSVRPALPESRSFQMVLEVPRWFWKSPDVSRCF